MFEAEASFWENPGPRGMKELLKKVRRLELIAGKHAHSVLKGDYLTMVPGDGLEFMEARRYVFGESVRKIDWNITARMRTPYVRIFQEEREREIFIVLDVSPSMHAGWQSRRKIEYAAEIAATLSHSAVSAGDRLGLVTYADRVRASYPTAKGKVQLFRVVRTIYESAVGKPAPCDVSDLRQAVFEIQKMRGRRFVIFFISDFIDYDVPEDLKYLQAVHEVYLIHLYDPLEYEAAREVSFLSRSPEGNGRLGASAPGSAGSLDRLRDHLKEESGRFRIRCVSLSTAVPMKKNLHELFHVMKARR